MLKKVALLCFAIVFCFSACAPRDSFEGSFESAVASASSESEPESSVQPSLAGPPPGFQEPELPYWILGESSWGENQHLVVYEEEHPDEYNKQFSQDTIFHAIRWQILDKNGKLIEKGDCDWSNGFPIHDYILSFEKPNDGTISFWVGMPKEYDRWPFRRKFTLVIDDSRLSLLGDNPNNIRYLIRDWYLLAESGGYTLESSEQYNQKTGQDETLLLLSDPLGNGTEVVIQENDRDFWFELYQLNRPGYVNFENEEPVASKMTVSLDASAKNVVFTIPKMTVTVNFVTGETITERHYTADMLQTLIEKSQDGQYSIYSAGEFGRFEGPSGCDYVSVGPDGAIHYLYAGSELDTITFVGNDRIVANNYASMILYDAATGLPSQQQPEMDYGEVKYQHSEELQKKYLTVGLAVDQKHERILAAVRRNTFGNFELEIDGEIHTRLPVSLAVFDFSGKLLSQQDTGFKMYPFGKFSIIPVEIKIDQAGNATIGYPQTYMGMDQEGPSQVSIYYLK